MQRLIFNYKFSFFRNKGHQQKKKHLLLHLEAKRGSLGVRARVEDEVKNDLSPSFIQFFMKCHLFVPQHQKRRPKINASSDPAVKSVASVPFFLFQPERVFRAQYALSCACGKRFRTALLRFQWCV